MGLAGGMIGTAIIGSAASAIGSSNAADAQVAAADKSAQLQREMFDKQVALQEPFRQGGITAQNRLLTLLGLTPDANSGLSVDASSPDYGKYARDFSMSDFTSDPGYSFRMSEGMKALNNSMAARGLGISGANIKGAEKYGQDLASQEYQNAFNRYQVNRSNQLNPLQSLMGSGQTSANTLTNAAGQLGQGLSDSALQAGNARASGYVGTANAVNNALSSGWNSYMGLQNYNMMNNMFSPNNAYGIAGSTGIY